MAAFSLLLAITLAFVLPVIAPRRASRYSRKHLIAFELALACILLTGAGLLTRSFLNLAALDPGFQPAHVLTAQIDLPPAKYPTGEKMSAFFREVLTDLGTDGEVSAAGLVTILPLGGLDRDGPGFKIAGRTDQIPASVTMPLVSPGYFEAMGIALERGRYFNERDTANSPGAAIISEACSRRWFKQGDAVGQQLVLWADDCDSRSLASWPTCAIGVWTKSRNL